MADLFPYLHTKTDDTLRETISHGDDRYPFAYYLENIWQFDFHSIDWHWHHELEFLSITEGTVICYIGEKKFELPQGCGLFINSSVLHCFETSGDCLIPNIVFSPELLAPEKSLIYEKYVDPILRCAPDFFVLDPNISWQNQLLQLLTAIYGIQEQKDTNELQTFHLLLELWTILWNHLHLNLTVETASRRPFSHRQARLQIMMQHIHNHYAKPITLDEIAASAAVSKSSALQLFQSGIHCSPVAYLIQYRLKCGAKLLRTTEKPVSAIAEETGFMSAGYFCRKFKEHYQISPHQYRSVKKDPIG